MSKFRSNGKREMPELNTSSLPDLIFTVLFFFMMVTSMRDVEVKVQVKTPTGGSEIEKLERKSLVSHISSVLPPSSIVPLTVQLLRFSLMSILLSLKLSASS